MRAAPLLLLLAACTSSRPINKLNRLDCSIHERNKLDGLDRSHPQVGGYYERALDHYNRGDFEKARDLARIALAKDPGHRAARKLLDDIYGIIAGPPSAFRTPRDDDRRASSVRHAQTRLEVRQHLRDGHRLFHARMYRKALREFDAAEIKLAGLPAADPDLLAEARKGRLQAKHALERP